MFLVKLGAPDSSWLSNWQAPYIIKAKVMIGAEKRSVAKLVDLDSFLVFLVETFKEEQVCVTHKSIPTQIRQIILYISHSD